MLAIALFIRARYEEVANGLLPLMNQATSLSLLVLFVAFFVVYISDLLGVIGTTAVIAAVLFLLISFIIGYFLGGSAGPIRSVLGLGRSSVSHDLRHGYRSARSNSGRTYRQGPGGRLE